MNLTLVGLLLLQVHVVDASGSTDREGREVAECDRAGEGGADPLADIG